MNDRPRPAATVHHLFPGPDAGLPSYLRPRAAAEGPPLSFEADGERWHTSVALPTLPVGTLLVPSLVIGDRVPDAYALRVQWPGAALDLAPIRVRATAPFSAARAHVERVAGTSGSARGGLDCLLVEETVVDARLELRGTGPVPDDATLLVGMRSRLVEVRDTGATAPDLPVPPRSQMTRATAIARHICSPLSVAMVMEAAGHAVDPEVFARSCEHPDHARLFGMWPLNLARARTEGFGGMVRQFEDVDEVAELLARGHPIVASIRFETGALPGAPLPRTGGHLVVLRGLGATSVLVNDPAAASDATVPRRYDRAAFLRAWLADRGIGYLLWPHGANLEATRQTAS